MDTQEDEGTLPSSAQVEMPYIPASQRAIKTHAGSTADDAIVVVGQTQTRRKKRKRAPKDTKPSEGTANEDKDSEEGEMTPFDFASAPNILDEAPAAEQSALPRKKAKQTKGMLQSFSSPCKHDVSLLGGSGKAFTGNFPAPPKAYSEVKSGNKSHTFK